MSLTLTLLGGFKAEAYDGSQIDLPTEKARALLAYLAVEAGPSHPRERLASLFWPDLPDPAAAANLRKTLFRLQRTLDGHTPGLSTTVLDVGRRDVALRAGAVTSDVRRFEGLLTATAAHTHRNPGTCDTCLANLQAATASYRGDLLTGVRVLDSAEFDEWLLLRRSELQDEARRALMSLVDAYVARSETDRALEAVRRLLELDPYSEAGHRHMMRLLANVGDVTSALTHYLGWRERLGFDLGLEPERATQELYEAIRTGSATTKPTATPIHGLPAQQGPCLGREAELLELESSLSAPACRLVTLLGPGGIGKTRTAVALAERLATKGAFPDGIYFVPLAQATTGEELWQAVARTLDILWAGQDSEARVIGLLRAQHSALVLDNLEHLPAAREAITRLLTGAPDLKVIGTSRVALDLHAEYRFPLAGLAWPEPTDASDPLGFSSVRLFVESAKRSRFDFALAEGDVECVAGICRVLAGSPLAIELAASWTRVLDCDEIADRLDDSLDLLASTKVDLPLRHRSLAATLAYSWDLLPVDARRLLADLAVFHGSVSLESVLAVTEASVVELSLLLDHSLLSRDEAGRYYLHQLLRQFAAERLAEDPAREGAVRSGHASHYLGLVSVTAPGLHGPGARRAVNLLRSHLADIRAAWEWTVEFGDVGALTAALDGVATLLDYTGLFAEGERLLAQAIGLGTPAAVDEEGAHLLGTAQVWSAHFQHRQGRPDQAYASASEAKSLAARTQDQHLAADANSLLAEILLTRAEFEEAKRVQRAALDHYLEGRRDRRLADALGRMATIVWRSGDPAEGRTLFERAEEIFREIGDDEGMARTLYSVAGIYWEQADSGVAHRLLNEASELYAGLGHPIGIADCKTGMAIINQESGHFAEALACNEFAVTAFRDLGEDHRLAGNLGNRASILMDTGDFDAARRAAEDALELALTLRHELQIARHTMNIGSALVGLGDDDGALEHFGRTLPRLRSIGPNRFVIVPLLGIADILVRRGNGREALAFTEEALA